MLILLLYIFLLHLLLYLTESLLIYVQTHKTKLKQATQSRFESYIFLYEKFESPKRELLLVLFLLVFN